MSATARLVPNRIRHGIKFSPRASQSSSLAKLAVTPIVELREYELQPSSVNKYLQITSDTGDLRKSLAPLRLFTMPETGGTLNVATHLYHWPGGYSERNDGRARMASSDEWKGYLKDARPCMVRQRSTIFVEAPLVAETDGVSGLEMGRAERDLKLTDGGGDTYPNSSIYEIRRYQLKLGYDTVPNFLELYGAGLPSKLSAEGTDMTTSLITLLYSEVGSLNELIEIWRHGGGTTAMERSRVAARGAFEWRKAIGEIAGLAERFTSTIHKPTAFSPLK